MHGKDTMTANSARRGARRYIGYVIDGMPYVTPTRFLVTHNEAVDWGHGEADRDARALFAHYAALRGAVPIEQLARAT